MLVSQDSVSVRRAKEEVSPLPLSKRESASEWDRGRILEPLSSRTGRSSLPQAHTEISSVMDQANVSGCECKLSPSITHMHRGRFKWLPWAESGDKPSSPEDEVCVRLCVSNSIPQPGEWMRESVMNTAPGGSYTTHTHTHTHKHTLKDMHQCPGSTQPCTKPCESWLATRSTDILWWMSFLMCKWTARSAAHHVPVSFYRPARTKNK